MFEDAKLYEEAYDQAVRKNEEAIAAIEEFKKELEGVRETLEENQKHLFQRIMAPLAGGKALMRAKLIRTNDVMVFLGDKWFLRTSSARAIEICNRKIARCNENKAEIELQTERFRSNREKVQEYEPFSGADLREIVEPYDEEAEKLWKEKHREKVREFKKQEAAERNKYNDEDIFRKLVSEKEDIDDDGNETDEDTDLDSDEDEDSIIEIVDEENQSSSGRVLDSSNVQNISQKIDSTNEVMNALSVQSSNPFGAYKNFEVKKLQEVPSYLNSVPSAFESDPSFENMNGTGHPDSCMHENTSQSQSAPKKRVSFSATDEFKCYLPSESNDDTNIILFKHSDAKPSPTLHKSDRIESPSDIYRMIVQGFNPKSILKKGTQLFPENQSTPTEGMWKMRHDTVYSGYNPPEDREEIVVGDISEKNPVVITKIDSSSRKPSQFRKARNKQ